MLGEKVFEVFVGGSYVDHGRPPNFYVEP
jgi:hypothetical protein